MRDRIRSRAQDLNIEKSVATKKAIEEATARAMAKEEAPTLDLSAFGASDDEDMSSSEDLTDDEREELDKYTKQGLLEQIKEEFSNVKWPTPGAALRLAGFMMIIFVLTAAYILKLDETVRYLYTEWGLIPKPDAEYDFSGLALPKGWENDMDSTADTVTGMMRQSVGDVADAIQQ